MAALGGDPLASCALQHLPVVGAACGDLRAMGDDQHLAVAREPRQALADGVGGGAADAAVDLVEHQAALRVDTGKHHPDGDQEARQLAAGRSEEHTSELQPLMRNPYAVFSL